MRGVFLRSPDSSSEGLAAGHGVRVIVRLLAERNHAVALSLSLVIAALGVSTRPFANHPTKQER